MPHMFPQELLGIKASAINTVNEFFGFHAPPRSLTDYHLSRPFSANICIMGKVASFSKIVQMESSFLGILWKLNCLCHLWLVTMHMFKVSRYFRIWPTAVQAVLFFTVYWAASSL